MDNPDLSAEDVARKAMKIGEFMRERGGKLLLIVRLWIDNDGDDATAQGVMHGGRRSRGGGKIRQIIVWALFYFSPSKTMFVMEGEKRKRDMCGVGLKVNG